MRSKAYMSKINLQAETTNSGEQEEQTEKKRICSEVTVTVWEIHIVNPEKEKGKATVGRICRKGRI